MTDLLLADDAARKAIISDLESDMFVEAGAGSGKTYALVSRALSLIVEGITTIDRMVLITFTEASAEELRYRIRMRLEDAHMSETDETRRKRLHNALLGISSARICTIHAFARSVLEQLGLFTNGSVVIDAAEELHLIHDRTFALLRERWPRENADTVEVLALLQQCGVTSRHWIQLLEGLHAEWHRCKNVAATPPPRIDLSDDYKLIANSVREVLDLRSHCTLETDSLFRFLETLESWTKIDAHNPSTQLGALCALPMVRKKMGAKANWPADVLEDIRTTWSQTIERCESIVQRVTGELTTWMTAEGAQVAVELAEERSERRLFTFHDLLVRCDEALADPSNCQQVRGSISHLFVDEFQDTDPLQWSIVSRLTADGADRCSLFVVGDPRQSIYRFRGADLGTFLAAQETITATQLVLTSSFRSVEPVVGFVNATSTNLFGEIFASVLSSVREAEPSALFGYEALEDQLEGLAIAQVREEEANRISQRIANLVTTTQIPDPYSGQMRPLRYNDVAILLPTRLALEAVTESLRAQEIPFAVESSTLIWNTQELRDLTAIIRAVADSSDEVALLAALRSPYFAHSDVELLHHVRVGGTWDRMIPQPSESSVTSSLQRLEDIAARIKWMTVSEAIAASLDALDAYQLARSEDDDEWLARLSFLMHAVRGYENRLAPNLLSFCDWADTQREDGARSYEYPARLGTRDAVRIMTIHAAKGLEFPVVAIAGLQSPRRWPTGVHVLWNDNNPEVRVAAKWPTLQTPGYSDAAEADRAEERAEERRLLYVALTRAREYLVVSLVRPMKGDSMAADLATMLTI